jgi:hypothetical protein
VRIRNNRNRVQPHFQLLLLNGAGKSNLISFFRMLQSLTGGRLADYVRDSGGIGDLLHNGRKATKQMEFQTRFGSRGYRFTLKPGPGEGFALADEARYYEPGSTGWWVLGSRGDHSSVEFVDRSHSG